MRAYHSSKRIQEFELELSVGAKKFSGQPWNHYFSWPCPDHHRVLYVPDCNHPRKNTPCLPPSRSKSPLTTTLAKKVRPTNTRTSRPASAVRLARPSTSWVAASRAWTAVAARASTRSALTGECTALPTRTPRNLPTVRIWPDRATTLVAKFERRRTDLLVGSLETNSAACFSRNKSCSAEVFGKTIIVTVAEQNLHNSFSVHVVARPRITGRRSIVHFPRRRPQRPSILLRI